MSETWKMPTWMQKVLDTAGPNWANWIEYEKRRSNNGVDDFVNILESLRTAGLLFTSGENDMHVRAYDQICKDLYRLRAENVDLLENYKRADRGLHECCDSKERIRVENERLTSDNHTLLGGHALVYCAYCGERFEAETDAEKDVLLLTHIKNCAKHPIAEIKAENKRLQGILDELVDQKRKEEA